MFVRISSSLNHYMFVVLRFLLPFIQPVLLRFVNRIFIAVSVELFTKC
jgi:hypothetical protein